MYKKPGQVSSFGSRSAVSSSSVPIIEPILYLDATDYSGAGSTWPADIGSNGTLVNSPTYVSPTPTYFSMNGVNEIAYTADLKSNFSVNDSRTLEIWVRTSTDNGVVISEQGTTLFGSGYHLSVMEIVEGDLKVGLWNGLGITSATVGAVTRDVWQQYVLTYDDNTNTLVGYINALTSNFTTLENDEAVPQLIYALCQADATNMGDGSYLAADIGLFRVWNSALSASEVLSLYNQNLARFNVTPTVSSFTTPGTTSWTAPDGVSQVEYLVVGGGGGGGNGYDSGGGGGGGGGMVLTGYHNVIPGQTYTITVGSGGTGGADTRTNNNGIAGDNSVFDTITALGGGFGQGSRTFAPTARYTGGIAQVGSGTATNGGGGGGGGDAGGGGGGSGGAGSTRTNASTAGIGGAGISSSITGSTVTYGAGGNGGTANVNNNDGSSGGNNTGKGGGAGSATGSNSGGGGNGGSGIVVIKFGQ